MRAIKITQQELEGYKFESTNLERGISRRKSGEIADSMDVSEMESRLVKVKKILGNHVVVEGADDDDWYDRDDPDHWL